MPGMLMGKKFQWNFNQNTNEKGFEYVVYKMVAILSRSQCVKYTVKIKQY